ncbi:MAG: glucosyl-3-phosphoglycerate synthase, partial [Euzebyales bacterium]|nr:glucosyl-3-phosphoglycerate synthase [Euzebyales bacterium]
SATALAGALVDEVVVIDGGSEDGTAGLAGAAGARVVADGALLAEHGPMQGKGDALWRSLTATSGDIVVFIDADIRNPDPRFVWGLLGPLLTDETVSFVKAFYDRPVQLDKVLYATGGGRVTELTARPLLNLFWPELAGLVQPLSGEYAGRRALLESVPFFTGYGVEIGLLIDILAAEGAGAIAQVDLATRIHRNQEMPSLSRMAYGIAQVAMRRLAEQGRATLATALPEHYVQFERGEAGVTAHATTISVVERPPIVSLRPAASRGRGTRAER